MTTEPKLLTEADVLQLAYMTTAERTAFLGERGLIAPEPVDAMLLEARRLVECTVQWSPQTDRDLQSGKNDRTPEVKIAIAALRRGREIGLAELTRERVRDAVIAARPIYLSDKDFDEDENTVDRIHAEKFLTKFRAALTDGEVGNG